jgi:DNA repair exonuclease SbcCD ATPase subunit
MKIINLKSENLKGIKVIDITPKDDMVIISGKNGAGKTSALDSIWYAMEWKAGSKGTPMPIRKGEKFAEVKLTLCEDLTEEKIKQGVKPKPLFIVIRSWTASGNTYLKVTNAEGLVYETPQKLLDGFIGYLSFDPREFTRMNDKDQRDLLIKITGFDVTKIEEKISELREKRRLQGQTIKLYEGERDDRDFSGIPTEKISITELQLELENAVDYNRDIDATIHQIEHNQETVKTKQKRILDLEDEINALKIGMKTYNNTIEIDQRFLEENKKKDIEPIRAKINKAMEINELIQAKNRNIQTDQKRDLAQKVYNDYTKEIEKSIAELEGGLKASWAKIPDQKLSLTETGIAYDSIPYSQISFSEQLKVAMKIAMALNTKLRVIRISDYSLLDEESKKTIRQMSKDENYQIWAETVDDTGTVGFYIEEGMIKNEN